MNLLLVLANLASILTAGSPAASQTLNLTAAVSAPSGTIVGSPNQVVNIWGASTHTFRVTGGVNNTNYSFMRAWGLTGTPGAHSWGSGGGFMIVTTDANGNSLTYTSTIGGNASFTILDGVTSYTATAATTGSSQTIPFLNPANGTATATRGFSTYGEG